MVSGMTIEGTVTADIPAGAATDAAGNPSSASTSMDNEVTFATNEAPALGAVTISNVAENGVATLRGTITDPDIGDTFTLEVDWGDTSPVETFNYPAGTTAFSETHRYLDDNPSGTPQDDYTVSLTLTDDDNGSATAALPVTVFNVAPVASAAPTTASAQYSDAAPEFTITGTDVAGDPMTASTQWSDGGPFVPGLPGGLTLTPGPCDVAVAANSRACTWAITGATTLPLGTYALRVSVADDDLGSTELDVTLSVGPEDATVAFDPANPVAVPVTAAGSNASEPFTLVAQVQETRPDVGSGPAPGDINLAQVMVTLEPVGPGPAVTTTCTPRGAVPPFDYDSVLTVECDFAGVPVNIYNAIARVEGGYYAGSGQGIVTVYDRSLGSTTGGGTYVDANGDRVNFGYTAKYHKKRGEAQGSLLVIRHTTDGIYRLKSNQIDSLAVGSGTSFSWASFRGTATYREPGDDAVGNYQFVVYVEDHATPGAGSDRFWVTAERASELAGGLAMDAPAADAARTLTGGNLVVHR
jgi:hypothetical protein